MFWLLVLSRNRRSRSQPELAMYMCAVMQLSLVLLLLQVVPGLQQQTMRASTAWTLCTGPGATRA